MALLLAGCGYRVFDARDVFGPDVKQIEITMFRNDSDQPTLEVMIGDAVSETFELRGPLVPVWSRPASGSDLVLLGTIDSVAISPTAFSSAGFTRENRITIFVQTDVRRAGSGDVVWQQSIAVDELFLASPDAQVNETNKEQALRRLSSLLAERIYDGLFQQL